MPLFFFCLYYRFAFSKHGIAIGIFSFFICFSKFFLMVKNASIIIGTTSAFLFQSFWISVISCVTSGFLFFNLVFWNRFVWLLYLFFRHFLLFYWHVCICIWSYSFLGLKFHSDLSPSVYVTGSGMWLFHLLLHSKWYLPHKFSEPFVLILPCLYDTDSLHNVFCILFTYGLYKVIKFWLSMIHQKNMYFAVTLFSFSLLSQIHFCSS